jgi:hypothetical protein
MWRSAFIVLLLVGSPALAGEARGVLHVGITITGTGARAPAKAAASVGGEQTAAGARAAAAKPSARVRPPQ